MFTNFELSKESIDYFLNELSKELKNLKCKKPIELILVGGSSILINYNFRFSSYDIDAYYKEGVLKQAINNIGDKLNLPNGWLNNDFIVTSSFTPKIIQYSEFYKQYNHVLNVRTITKEYLISMKLVSFRKYKHDISDIVGIINEDSTITLERIKDAVIKLYGNYDVVNKIAWKFVETIFKKDSLKEFKKEIEKKESHEEQKLKKIIKKTRRNKNVIMH